MVQLKGYCQAITTPGIASFQFQNGTIKSKAIAPAHHVFVRFNSKMVQLKVVSCYHREPVPVFQFQNGTIKRDHQSQRLCQFFRFNSKMVQLKGFI